MRHYLSVTCPACYREVVCAYESDDSTYAGLDHVHAVCKHCDCKIAVNACNVEKCDMVTKDVVTAEYVKIEQKRLQRNTKARERYNAIPEMERLVAKSIYNKKAKANRHARGLNMRGRKPMTAEEKAQSRERRIEKNRADYIARKDKQ